jgi:hypothetical protein
MDGYLDQLPDLVEKINSIKETIIANTVLIGRVPSKLSRKKAVNFYWYPY